MKYPQTKTLKRKLTTVFNAFIRKRDCYKGCISCMIRPVQQAGHYWPVSGNPHGSMRYNEMNVHGQCTVCNTFREGNRQGYRDGLIKRHGKQVLDKLDITRSLRQDPWYPFHYEILIKEYKQKLKEMG